MTSSWGSALPAGYPEVTIPLLRALSHGRKPSRTRIASHHSARVSVKAVKARRQLEKQGGHTLRVVPRCTVIEFSRFGS